jgi:hypothetical protein
MSIEIDFNETKNADRFMTLDILSAVIMTNLDFKFSLDYFI